MNILICGATNYGNVGDDCIRNVIIEYLAYQYPKANIKCTRPYPQRELIEWADKVIIGGGGIIYDRDDANFDYYIRKYLQWSIELNKPVCLLSVGFQELKQKENIDLLAELLKNVNYFSVRQQQDLEFIQTNNLASNAILADDLGFLTVKANYTYTMPSDKLKVCIVPYKDWTPSYLEEVKNYIIQNKDKVDFYLTTSSYEDNDIIDILQPLIGESGSVREFKYLIPSELVSLLGEMDYVLTSRFHCAIFANIGGCKNIFHLLDNYKLSGLITKFDFNIPLTKQKSSITTTNDPSLHLKMLNKFLKG